MTEIESRPIEGFEPLPGALGSYLDAAKLSARYGLTWPLHIKLTLNAWLGRDMCQLNWRERQQIKMMPAFTRVLRISPRSFKFRMTGRRRHNVVSFNRDHLDRIPLVEFDTFVFVDEIVRQGLPYEKTALYSKLTSGKLRKLMRPLKTAEDPRQWGSIQSEAGFKRYYDRCMRLAESIADHGIFDMSIDGRRAQALRFGHDENILVAIDERGELNSLAEGQAPPRHFARSRAKGYPRQGGSAVGSLDAGRGRPLATMGPQRAEQRRHAGAQRGRDARWRLSRRRLRAPGHRIPQEERSLIRPRALSRGVNSIRRSPILPSGLRTLAT